METAIPQIDYEGLPSRRWLNLHYFVGSWLGKKTLSHLLISSLILILFTLNTFARDITYTDSNFSIILDYDPLNRPLNKSSNSTNFTYTYDQEYFGTLTNITFPNGSVQYEYDDKLRAIKEIRNIDNQTFVKQYFYDSADRLVSQGVLSTDLDYLYNKQARIKAIPGFISNASYSAFSSLLNRTYNNNLISRFSYLDANNRLQQIITGSVQNLLYTYDSVGNILSINDSVGIKDYRMGYDHLDRLTNVTINQDLYQYEYDSLGNILKINSRNATKRLLYHGSIPHAPSQIIEGSAGVGVYAPASLDTDSRNRTFEFFLVNEKLSNQTNNNFSVDFGTVRFNSSISINISSNPIMVLVQNNYTNAGNYTLNISTDTDTTAAKDQFGITIKSLTLNSLNISLATLNLTLENNINQNISNVNWNCSTGNKSSSALTLSGNSEYAINISYNFSSAGIKTVTCFVISPDSYGNKTLDFEIKGLKIENVSLKEIDANSFEVNFNLNNYYHPLTAAWALKSDNQSFSGSVSLNNSQIATVTQAINFSDDGAQQINITVTSSDIKDTYLDNLVINALEFGNYLRYDFNDTRKIMAFDLYQYWPGNVTVSWNISDPFISNSTSLEQNKSLMVIIETNYTSDGRKEPNPRASSGLFSSQYPEYFYLDMVGMLSLQVLTQSVNNTVSEMIAKSFSGAKTSSWGYDTGYENFTSSLPFNLSNSSSLIILIQHNYSQAGVYATNASINSSSFQDNVQGVVVT
ncbi:hypothetical protein HYV84_01360 [Candidatus Woesearchaeota archaeon]|nr:hypothetical protein [Candidatus Woesearchaeota archaeon]